MTSAAAAFPVYSPSGRVSSRVLGQLVVVGVPGVALCAGLYALCLHYSPAAVVAVLGLVFCSVFTGVVCWLTVRRGHVRSPRFAFWAGLALAAFGLWVHWCVFAYLEFQHGKALALHLVHSGPHGWWVFFDALAEVAVQTSPQRFMAGWLPAAWAVEAFLLLSIPASLSRLAATEPYSEVAHRWAEKTCTGELWWAGGLSAMLGTRLAEEGVGFLLSHPRAVELGAPAASCWWTILLECSAVEEDPDARWVSVFVLTHQRRDNGRIATERTAVLADWCVSAEDYARLSAHLDAPAPSADAEPTAEGEEGREFATALADFENDAFESALLRVEGLLASDNAAMQADAWRLSALCLSRMGQWSRAYDAYRVLFERHPDAHTALQLATTAVMCGEVARGEQWFVTAEALNRAENAVPWADMLISILSAFASTAQWRAGLPYLVKLRQLYECSQSTDDTFLFMQRLPFLQSFFDKSLPFVRAAMDEDEVLAWYAVMRGHLDDGGRRQLDAWLNGLRAGCRPQ